MPGIHYVRVWLNEGMLEVGDDIMLVLIGGDIRPHVVDALQTLVRQDKKDLCGGKRTALAECFRIWLRWRKQELSGGSSSVFRFQRRNAICFPEDYRKLMHGKPTTGIPGSVRR